MTVHFTDRRGAASLRHSNRAATTVGGGGDDDDDDDNDEEDDVYSPSSFTSLRRMENE